MARHRWIYKNGQAIPAEEYTPEPTHYVQGDWQPYQSMCDGSMIEGRRQHREHLKAHGVIEIGNEVVKPRADLRNTGAKEAVIRAVQRAKEQYGSRHVERAISETLNKAYELRRR